MAAQSSSRKQWRLCRGPKGNIQSLGWAEFGCPESQYRLARELLNDNEEECLDKEEKARLGVYWLLKASEKGHDEATNMLQECLNSGTGITEHNLSDVKACLEMPRGEKLSREAAKELFLSLSQGENYITGNQLYKEISKYSEGPFSAEPGAGKDWIEYGRNEKLTEEMMITGGSEHLRGELPAILKHCPSDLVRNRWSGLAIAVNRLSTVPLLPHPYLLIPVLTMFSITSILDALPSILYHSSLLLMILSTCQILSKKWQFNQFKLWSNALVACGCTEEVSAQALWTHCQNNVTPSLIFILALCVNIISSSYVPMPPYSEITILSALFSLYTLYNFSWNNKKIDKLVLAAFIIHLLARYPYEMDTFFYSYWKHLDIHVPQLTSYVVALGSSVEYSLNLRVLLYLMLPSFFLKLAARERWLGIYTSLLPLLVSLSWWQISVITSNGATQFGLIRSCIGLVLILVFLPVTSITLFLLPLIALSKFLLTEQISFPFAVLSILCSTILYYGVKHKTKRRILHIVQVLLCILSAIVLLDSSHIETETKTRSLDVRELSSICERVEVGNQEVCAMLSGVPVSGEGRVTFTRIASVSNPLLPLIQHLPQDLQGAATCFLGERYEGCKGDDCNESQRNCRISNWNKYEYEVGVEIERNKRSGIWIEEDRFTAILRGGQPLRNFSISLALGDRISFAGVILHSGAKSRGNQLFISVNEVKCLDCTSTIQSLHEDLPKTILESFIRKLFNFMFYPFAELR